MRHIISFLVQIFLLLSTTAYTQTQYRFQHYGRKDGLANDFTYSLAQDSLGYIWVQYYGGLSRYNGYNFKIYKYDPDDSLRSALNFAIGHLYTDPSGNIWLTEHHAGNIGRDRPYLLVRYDRKSDSFIKFEVDLKGAIAGNICFEKDGSQVWLAGFDKGLFHYSFRNRETTNYINRGRDGKSQRPYSIRGIKDLGHSLLITSDVGLWEFDKVNKSFKRPACNRKDSTLLFHNLIDEILQCPHVDNPHSWIMKGDSLLKLGSDLTILQKSYFPYAVGSWRCDREGVFWFNSWGDAMLKYDARDSSTVNLKHNPNDPHSLRSNDLYDILVDTEQNVWATTNMGLSVLRKRDLKFYNVKLESGTIYGNTVFEANDKDYVMVSKYSGGNITDSILIASVVPGRLSATKLQHVPQPINGFVFAIHRGKNYFWIGTQNDGIFGYPIDKKTGMLVAKPFKVMQHDPQNNNTIRSNFVNNLWEDSNENLWVGRFIGGMDRVVLNVPYGTPGSVERLNEAGYIFFPEDEKSFWAVSIPGLRKVLLPTAQQNGYSIEPEFDTREKGPTVINKISDGRFIVGTVRGLYEATKDNKGYKLIKNSVMEGSDVLSIQEDELGRLWLYGGNQIMCFDRTDSTITRFDESDGIDHVRAFEPGWMRRTSRGIFVVVSPEGISLFDPKTFQKSNKKINPVLTGLEVNNATLMGRTLSDDPNFSIASDISLLKDLILDYQHNNFSIEFSAMEMTAPGKILYRHKLEGFDKDWIESDWKNRTATYTNLAEGNYKFLVRVSNRHGVWSERETTLNVVILPPPWRTWWAYSLYALVIIGTILLWRNYEVKRVKLKHRAEHLAEVDHLKSRFFANISHEFRTPITLVLGPLKDHYKQLSDPDQKNVIGLVIRNGQRLQRLINQLLDLTKVEAGKMELHASYLDLVQLLREITSSYESLAKEKHIRYFFYPEVQELMVYADEEKIEKIIHNLLSNAFKFTKEGGEIILNLKVHEKGAVISVVDSGIGIPGDQLNKVFDRFYQVDSSQTRGYEGSGLGLALAKDLVELHHGKISVHSKEGKGTTFTVTFPLGKEHLRKDEIADRSETVKAGLIAEDFVPSNGREVVMETEKVRENETASEGPVLLIVEDNIDMRQYIRKTLSAHYQIIEAENGKDGVKKAEENMPDLVISDIMMPEMDGITMTAKLKEDIHTSHIPIILLTAKATEESKISGLNTGADDFLVKPFNSNELILRVRNMIESRIRVREKVRLEFMRGAPPKEAISADEKLLQKVKEAILNRLSDEQLSVDSLAEEIGLSRAHFYRKVTALTGLPVNELIQSFRLERAAQLLAQQWGPVSQVAYEVGFSNPSYFSKCFKDKFGVSPSEYPLKDQVY